MLPYPEKFDPIYAAMAGAVIALVGAFLNALISGRQARKRQELELAHSATQKELERLHSLRREVYLPFCDASATAMAFVPTIPNCPPEQVRVLQPIIELGRHFARISLIAPASVIEPSTRAFHHLQAIITTLLFKRLEIDDAGSKLKLNQEATQIMIERLKNINEQMEGFLGSEAHRSHFDSLQKECQVLTSKIDESIAIGEELNHKRFNLEMAAQRQAVIMIGSTRKHSIEACIAIREEIGLPLDDKWFREFSERSHEESAALLAKFQDDIERNIN